LRFVIKDNRGLTWRLVVVTRRVFFVLNGPGSWPIFAQLTIRCNPETYRHHFNLYAAL